jgi:hypothetical protein
MYALFVIIRNMVDGYVVNACHCLSPDMCVCVAVARVCVYMVCPSFAHIIVTYA